MQFIFAHWSAVRATEELTQFPSLQLCPSGQVLGVFTQFPLEHESSVQALLSLQFIFAQVFIGGEAHAPLLHTLPPRLMHLIFNDIGVLDVADAQEYSLKVLFASQESVKVPESVTTPPFIRGLIPPSLSVHAAEIIFIDKIKINPIINIILSFFIF